MELIEFGKYFSQIRVESGYKSQRELAEVSGVSNSTINRIESGAHKAQPETLKILSEFLSVSFEELLKSAGYLDQYDGYYQYTFEDIPSPLKENELTLSILGARLKVLRIKRDLSISKTAHYLNMSEDKYFNIEKGQINLSSATINNLAAFFEVTVEQLLGTEDLPHKPFISKDNATEVKEKKGIIYGNRGSGKTSSFVSFNPILPEGFSEAIYLDRFDRYFFRGTSEEQSERIPVYEGILEDSGGLSNKIISYEYISKSNLEDGAYFFQLVTDNEMILEGIRKGYRLLIRRQEKVENGELALVQIKGEKSVLRRVFSDNGGFILQAANNNISPRFINKKKLRVVGKVVRVEFDPNAIISKIKE